MTVPQSGTGRAARRRYSASSMMRSGAILAAGLLLLAGNCKLPHSQLTKAVPSLPAGRLPSHVRPTRYTLSLEIAPQQSFFAGTADIEIVLDRPVSNLWLHGRDLTVESVSVQPAFEAALPGSYRIADPSGIAQISFPRPVGPGTATLRIVYTAAFNEQLRGLYRVKEDESWYAFTQFEPTSARRAFPGFDEPSFKTPFDVTLTVGAEYTAIANTPALEQRRLPDGRNQIHFATTRPLPTYLVAWAVGPFDVVDGPSMPTRAGDSGAIPFRGIATKGRGPQLDYAITHTAALLGALETYFGTDYPYRKLDVISVPDFDAGAMENAGAITFRDSLLLLDDETAPEWQRRAFSYVMAHELAHQWFGNLVTMEWWDDLWLNEAFATWMGRRVVQDVAPEQESALAMLADIHKAMSSDSQISARSIRQPIESHHDIHNAFDGITYSKGAGVLGMFEHWLGESDFRRGISVYLERHRFGNATEADLLAALSEASGHDVAAPFRSFLTQPGVPFLQVESECRDGKTELVIEQSRYLPIGSGGDHTSAWQIPVCVRYGALGGWTETCHLIGAREQRVSLEGACADWVMPNSGATGYYRWALAPEDGARLLGAGWPNLSPPERLSVAMNLEASFRAGALSVPEVFSDLAALASDPNRLVAQAPMGLLSLAREHLVEPGERRWVEDFAQELYRARYHALGWDAAPAESGESKLLRRSVIHFLAFTGRDPQVRAEALRRGRIHLGLDRAGTSDTPLDAELIDTALAVAVQDGEPAVFDAILARLDGERDALERSRILRALGAARTPDLIARARALALAPRLRINEMLSTLWSQSNDVDTRLSNWRWVEEHFDALVERGGPGRARRLPWMASGLCSQDAAVALEEFLAPRIEAVEGGPRNMAGSLETIRLCAALRSHHKQAAQDFFRSNAAPLPKLVPSASAPSADPETSTPG
ncbi:MAG: M1 family metallopeptidase [Myxococcota bacterium]